MNFSKAQIAALVLGYLKSEKLPSVVDEFIKCCCYFSESNENVRIGRYFVTRVAGMSLVDILEQYSVIYAMVQGRLEETNYQLYNKTTLVEQLLYLLEKEPIEIASSTPVNVSSEVDATPAHTLPGNSFVDSENSLPKTPKKRNTRSKSREKEEVIDMTEVLTQSLLDNHELHEKIAETINIVRNTPEVAKTVLDECISVGASKEIDAVIKTVIQKTEEDPVYNKLIDEIIGTSSYEAPPPKKPTHSSPILEEPKAKPIDEGLKPNLNDPIEAHNNDAIRSIIEAAQNSDPPPPPPPKPDSGGEVYLFDGSLDSYLKTSGATNTMNSNPVFINPGGLIVMPPPETTKQQFYIVNNQPVIKMNMPTVLTENEFMSIPTVIVNDEGAKKRKPIKPKVVPREPPKLPETENSGRIASHVRNLDFSTPRVKKGAKAWDTDLRQLATGCTDKSPSPKRKRPCTKKKKTKKVDEEVEVEEEKTPEEREKAGLMTPVKDIIPKTPAVALSTSGFHCTPFNDVIDEQLRGVDLSSIPTPSLPITPGFALTPGDMVGTNHRSTDYSTSSSYYQPSESEPPKSTEDLMEELRGLDNSSPTNGKSTTLNIISNTLITPAHTEEKKAYTEHINKFNNKVIGKKNLNLIPTHSSSSSSSSSDSDSDPDHEKNETVVCSKDPASLIKDIINNVELKMSLDEEEQKKRTILSKLEVVRQRTVNHLKNNETKKKPVRNTTKKTPKIKAPRAPRKTKKKEPTPENTDEEAQKMVEGLAQRGIHLMHNKTPQKKNEEKKVENEGEEVLFDVKSYEQYEVATHTEKTRRKSTKTYDFTVLKKAMSIKVFIDDTDQEMTRIIKWTDPGSLFDSHNDELTKNETRGGKKRKGKFGEEDGKVKEKKSKTYANYTKLLKKVDVDVFLDKVHGE